MSALDPMIYGVVDRFRHYNGLPDPPSAWAIDQQLAQIAKIINEIAEMTPQCTNVAPEKPREGMIRTAIPPWLPLGGSVLRRVVYSGGAWVAL